GVKRGDDVVPRLVGRRAARQSADAGGLLAGVKLPLVGAVGGQVVTEVPAAPGGAGREERAFEPGTAGVRSGPQFHAERSERIQLVFMGNCDASVTWELRGQVRIAEDSAGHSER